MMLVKHLLGMPNIGIADRGSSRRFRSCAVLNSVASAMMQREALALDNRSRCRMSACGRRGDMPLFKKDHHTVPESTIDFLVGAT
jgi:hypothetical protein